MLTHVDCHLGHTVTQRQVSLCQPFLLYVCSVPTEAGSIGADVHNGLLLAALQQVQDALSHRKCANHIHQQHLLEVMQTPADSNTCVHAAGVYQCLLLDA